MNISKNQIIDWISQHEQLWEDCINYFQYNNNNLENDEIEEFYKTVSTAELLSWLMDHEEAWNDFKKYFNLDSLDFICNVIDCFYISNPSINKKSTKFQSKREDNILNIYEITCKGVIWDLNEEDEEDEENIYADNYDLPEDITIKIEALTEEEAVNELAEKLSQEYGYLVNSIQSYSIKKIRAMKNENREANSAKSSSGTIGYNKVLQWLYKMPSTWRSFINDFEEDEDSDILHISVDPRDCKDWISEQDDLYDMFITEFGNKEIVYD